MIYSMTGYGRGDQENDKYKIVAEIKTVNHRYCDIIIKMPKKLIALEEMMKSHIKETINRGRVEVYINYDELLKNDVTIKPNFGILDQYHEALMAVRNRYQLDANIDLGLMARYPDAMDVVYDEADLEVIWEVMKNSLTEALDSVKQMRQVEGDKLVVDVRQRVGMIESMLEEIEKLSPEILVNHKQKMIDRIQEVLEDQMEVDQERVIHEVAVYADKTNITEEIVRLRSHFGQLDKIISGGGAVGRKLDFLVQELNREVNTIGSKSPDIDISNYVIDMKSEIEKIREQIQNIE